MFFFFFFASTCVFAMPKNSKGEKEVKRSTMMIYFIEVLCDIEWG